MNLKERLQEEIHRPAIINIWHNRETLNKYHCRLVYWNFPQRGCRKHKKLTPEMGNTYHGLRTPHLTNYETMREVATSDFPRGCGHTPEDVFRVIKYRKISSLQGKLTKLVSHKLAPGITHSHIVCHVISTPLKYAPVTVTVTVKGPSQLVRN